MALELILAGGVTVGKGLPSSQQPLSQLQTESFETGKAYKPGTKLPKFKSTTTLTWSRWEWSRGTLLSKFYALCFRTITTTCFLCKLEKNEIILERSVGRAQLQNR